MAKSTVPPEHQLLMFLNGYGDGIPVNIIAELKELYSDVPENNREERMAKRDLVNNMLSDLRYRQLINGSTRIEMHETVDNTFLVWPAVTTSISRRGILFLEGLIQRERDELTKQLALATLAANQATVDSFAETKKSNGFQRKTQNIIIAVAIISAIASLISAWVAYATYTNGQEQATELREIEKKLQMLQQEIKKNSTYQKYPVPSIDQKKKDSALKVGRN